MLMHFEGLRFGIAINIILQVVSLLWLIIQFWKKTWTLQKNSKTKIF